MKTLGVVLGAVFACVSFATGLLVAWDAAGTGIKGVIPALIACVFMAQATGLARNSWEIATGRRVYRYTKEGV